MGRLFKANKNSFICVGGQGLSLPHVPPYKKWNQYFILLNRFYPLKV